MVQALWGDQCERYSNISRGDSLIIKGAKVSDFAGKTLNLQVDDSLLLNPANERTKQLTEWYQKLLSERGKEAGLPANFKSLSLIKNQNSSYSQNEKANRNNNLSVRSNIVLTLIVDP